MSEPNVVLGALISKSILGGLGKPFSTVWPERIP